MLVKEKNMAVCSTNSFLKTSSRPEIANPSDPERKRLKSMMNLQVSFQIPMRMLLCPDVMFVPRKLMSILVLIVTRNVVMIAEKHIVIFLSVKLTELTNRSSVAGIAWKIAFNRYF